MDTWIIRDPRFLEHDPGPGHPENRHRLDAVYRTLDAAPIPGTVTRSSTPVTREILGRAHSNEYVARVESTAGEAHTRLDTDTFASPRSYESAVHAAGAVVQAVDAVHAGRAGGAFALVRPPGHHAERSAAMGFCLFNNVAVAAQYALDHLGTRRILVLDPDVHHGNGTQNTFYETREVLYVSSHQHPLYPGTGWFDEVGHGDGEGFTVNLPCPAGLGDTDFFHLYDTILSPVVAEYAPELILVSAGYDTWHTDPLGGMRVTREGYRALFALVASWSAAHCPGRLVFALEGGYDPAGVIAGVEASLEALTGATPAGVLDAARAPAIAGDGRQLVESVHGVVMNARSALEPYWASLRNNSARSR